MSYTETRPVICDPEADVELEARVMPHDCDAGLSVRLRLRPLVGVARIENADLFVPAFSWQAFVDAVNDQLDAERRREKRHRAALRSLQVTS